MSHAENDPTRLLEEARAHAPGRDLLTLLGAIRPLPFLEGHRPYAVPAELVWELVCRGLDVIEASGSEEQRREFERLEPAFQSALEAIPDRYRKAPHAWWERVAKGERPLGWSLVRALSFYGGPVVSEEMLENIRSIDVDDKHAQELTAWVFPKVKHLYSVYNLSVEQMAVILDGKAFPALSELEISLRDEVVLELANMSGFARIRGIKLYGNNLDKGLKKLLGSKHISQLERLILWGSVKSAAAKSIVTSKKVPPLKELHVAQYVAGPIQAIGAALSDKLSQLERLTFGSASPLRELKNSVPASVKHLGLGLLGFAEYAEEYPSDARLRYFEIDGWLTPKNASALVAWSPFFGIEELWISRISDRDHAEVFSIFANHLEVFRDLRTVSLTLGDLDDAGIAELARFFQGSPRLESVHLWSRDATVGREGAKALCRALASLEGLRVLMVEQIPALLDGLTEGVSFAELAMLSIDEGTLTEEHARGLTHAAFPSLRYLHFMNTTLEPAAARALASSDLGIASLTFTHQTIEPEAQAALGQGKGLPALRSLDISLATANASLFEPLRAAGIAVHLYDV